MNLVWIACIVIALAVSVGVFVVGSGAILYFFRRRKWWVRAILICVLPVLLCLLWSSWLGPHDLTEPNELAARFELVFGFAPDSSITVDHYRVADGPDDMGEWFSLLVDINELDRLSPDLKSTSPQQFAEVGSQAPDWWLVTPVDRFTHYHGSIPTKRDRGPSYREIWVAYDHSKRRAFCYIHSLL